MPHGPYDSAEQPMLFTQLPGTENSATPGEVQLEPSVSRTYLRTARDRFEQLRTEQAAGRGPLLLPFWGHHARSAHPGPWTLSQWWPEPFTHDGVTYPHAESFMMAGKARLFGDQAALERILSERDPKTVKDLGRTVCGFDTATWNAHAYDIVVQGNLAKFGAHEHLRRYLLSTAPAVLVEASPYDRIWGIGLRPTDPAARVVSQWRGRNLLGFALTEVREQLTRP